MLAILWEKARGYSEVGSRDVRNVESRVQLPIAPLRTTVLNRLICKWFGHLWKDRGGDAVHCIRCRSYVWKPGHPQ